jgi:predicted dehydrogenase
VDSLWDLAAHDLSILVRLGVLTEGNVDGLRVDGCLTVPDGAVAGCTVLDGGIGPATVLRVHACWMQRAKRRRFELTGTGDRSLILEEDDASTSVLLRRGERVELVSRTPKGDRGTPIESAMAEFAAGVRGVPDLANAEQARLVVDVLERLTAAARPVSRTVGAQRCWL